MSNAPRTYLLAGGGTAGHVNPLLAVADGLREREPEATVLVLGTAEGLESRLVPERGYPLLIVDKVPFPRRPNKAAVAFPWRFRRAVKQVRGYLHKHNVDVIVGFGGYASAPGYVAAARERIPFIVHEANAKPGLANILGARRAAGVGVAFDGTTLHGSTVVGMPLRSEIVSLNPAALRSEAADFFGLDPARPTLLAFGGSLGAKRINEALAESWRDVLDAGWQLIHITGERSTLTDPEVVGYAPRRYVDRMDLAFSMADIVLCRAGAATVSEVSALGIPAVYVPYAVGNGEQEKNAASAVRAGAAILIRDAELTADQVRTQIIPMLTHPQRRNEMARAAEGVGIRNGTNNVIAMIDHALS